MTIAENLRARAAYMREHGFSPYFGQFGAAACFMAAGVDDEDGQIAIEFLRATIFDGRQGSFSADMLKAERWTTDDAVAALEWAADIAEFEQV